jgi:molecular chaperone GrpE
MSEFPPSGVAQDAAVSGVPALTPEAIAAVLEDFRGWLTAAAAAGAAEPMAEQPLAEGAVDLFTLVGQFTALRQEVNLQTRAVRAQQEQNAETLRHLAEAVDLLSQAPAAAPQWREAPADDPLRPLLKTLVDLYDAASLAGRELQRVQDAASATLRPIEEAAAGIDAKEDDEPDWRPPAAVQPSWLARRFGAPGEDAGASYAAWKAEWTARRRREREAIEERLRRAREAAERIRQTLAATAAGYAMTLQRVERAMTQHDLEPIPAVGQPFDPELMEVLEVVLDSGLPSGEVVEEVRRGYLWQGRVFRYAQVRVAKNSGS